MNLVKMSFSCSFFFALLSVGRCGLYGSIMKLMEQSVRKTHDRPSRRSNYIGGDALTVQHFALGATLAHFGIRLVGKGSWKKREVGEFKVGKSEV